MCDLLTSSGVLIDVYNQCVEENPPILKRNPTFPIILKHLEVEQSIITHIKRLVNLHMHML